MRNNLHRHTQRESIPNFMGNCSSNRLGVSSHHFHSKLHLIQLTVARHIHREFPHFWKLLHNIFNSTWEYVSGNTRSRRLRRRGGSFGMGCTGTTRNGYIRQWAIGARSNTVPYNQPRWLDCGGHYTGTDPCLLEVPGHLAQARNTDPSLTKRAHRADSSGRCNIIVVDLSEQVGKHLCRRFPLQRFTRPGIEGGRHGRNLFGTVHAQIRAFREILA